MALYIFPSVCLFIEHAEPLLLLHVQLPILKNSTGRLPLHVIEVAEEFISLASSYQVKAYQEADLDRLPLEQVLLEL